MNRSSFYEQIKSLSSNQIRSYLVSNNWVESGNLGRIATIWHRPDSENSESEIILPEDANLRDYSARIRDILVALSEHENRIIEEIFADISTYFADIIKVRVVHDDVENGTIPLKDGVVLIERTLDLLTSATLSTLDKKRHFSNSRSKEVSDFIDKARLGQTEIGSYIINVIAPINHYLFEDSSFSRSVTITLAKSLSAIKNIVDNKINDNMTTLDRAVEEGVSANLCDALIGLSGDQESRDFQISVSFSYSKPQESNFPNKIEHTFKASSIPYIKEASNYLKEKNYIIKDKKVSGIVNKLDRPSNKDIGSVTIKASIENREQNVTFELLPEDYLKAIRAHENKQLVECYGDICISPRSAKLINSHDFRVIEFDSNLDTDLKLI